MSEEDATQDSLSGGTRCTWLLHKPDGDERPFASCYIAPMEEEDEFLAKCKVESTPIDEIRDTFVRQWQQLMSLQDSVSENSKEAVRKCLDALWRETQTTAEQSCMDRSSETPFDIVRFWVTPDIDGLQELTAPPTAFCLSATIHEVGMNDGLDIAQRPRIAAQNGSKDSTPNVRFFHALPLVGESIQATGESSIPSSPQHASYPGFWRVHNRMTNSVFLTCSLTDDIEAGEQFDPNSRDPEKAERAADVRQSVFDCWMRDFTSWNFKGGDEEEAQERWEDALREGSRLCHELGATVAVRPKAGIKQAYGSNALICSGARVGFESPLCYGLQDQVFTLSIMEG